MTSSTKTLLETLGAALLKWPRMRYSQPVARVALHNMRQDRDKPIHAYGARLRGQASVCKFTQNYTGCETNMDFIEVLCTQVFQLNSVPAKVLFALLPVLAAHLLLMTILCLDVLSRTWGGDAGEKECKETGKSTSSSVCTPCSQSHLVLTLSLHVHLSVICHLWTMQIVQVEVCPEVDFGQDIGNLLGNVNLYTQSLEQFYCSWEQKQLFQWIYWIWGYFSGTKSLPPL